MKLNEQIIVQRKTKGLTQEELANLCKVNLRTIQRIENGESNPRPFTLKALETALDFRATVQTADDKDDTAHFLSLFCISCFSYLVIPYVHFLVPNYLLNRRKEQNPEIRSFAKKVIRTQMYWVVATMLVFLVVLFVNFATRYYLNTGHYISYLVPFFGMYTLNGFLIGNNILKARTLAV